jgi:MFS family permease
MTGIVFFAAGSLLCGVAPENATLIGGRMLAGLGAALQNCRFAGDLVGRLS